MKGSKELDQYLLYYNGVEREKRKATEVAIYAYIRKKWHIKICSHSFVNEQIITIRIRVNRGNVTTIAVYGPEESSEYE